MANVNKLGENVALIVTNGDEIRDLIKFLIKFNIRWWGEIQISLVDAYSRRGRADWPDREKAPPTS